jgi:hypothetical protein
MFLEAYVFWKHIRSFRANVMSFSVSLKVFVCQFARLNKLDVSIEVMRIMGFAG